MYSFFLSLFFYTLQFRHISVCMYVLMVWEYFSEMIAKEIDLTMKVWFFDRGYSLIVLLHSVWLLRKSGRGSQMGFRFFLYVLFVLVLERWC